MDKNLIPNHDEDDGMTEQLDDISGQSVYSAQPLRISFSHFCSRVVAAPSATVSFMCKLCALHENVEGYGMTRRLVFCHLWDWKGKQ